jgi:hypothetical protein
MQTGPTVISEGHGTCLRKGYISIEKEWYHEVCTASLWTGDERCFCFSGGIYEDFIFHIGMS